jgi:hypothetical protein
MDFFFFQLAVIFLPGLVWERRSSSSIRRRRFDQCVTQLKMYAVVLT